MLKNHPWRKINFNVVQSQKVQRTNNTGKIDDINSDNKEVRDVIFNRNKKTKKYFNPTKRTDK